MWRLDRNKTSASGPRCFTPSPSIWRHRLIKSSPLIVRETLYLFPFCHFFTSVEVPPLPQVQRRKLLRPRKKRWNIHNKHADILGCMLWWSTVYRTHAHFAIEAFLVLCLLAIFSTAGFKVFPSKSGSAHIHVQVETTWGPRPVTAFPPVSPCASTSVQLRSLQGNIWALWDTLLRLRKPGWSLRSAVPVQSGGADVFRCNSTTQWSQIQDELTQNQTSVHNS